MRLRDRVAVLVVMLISIIRPDCTLIKQGGGSLFPKISRVFVTEPSLPTLSKLIFISDAANNRQRPISLPALDISLYKTSTGHFAWEKDASRGMFGKVDVAAHIVELMNGGYGDGSAATIIKGWFQHIYGTHSLSHDYCTDGSGITNIFDRHDESDLFAAKVNKGHRFHANWPINSDPSSLIDNKIIMRIMPHEESNDGITNSGEDGYSLKPFLPPWLGLRVCNTRIYHRDVGWTGLRRGNETPSRITGFFLGMILWVYGLFLVLP